MRMQNAQLEVWLNRKTVNFFFLIFRCLLRLHMKTDRQMLMCVFILKTEKTENSYFLPSFHSSVIFTSPFNALRCIWSIINLPMLYCVWAQLDTLFAIPAVVVFLLILYLILLLEAFGGCCRWEMEERKKGGKAKMFAAVDRTLKLQLQLISCSTFFVLCSVVDVFMLLISWFHIFLWPFTFIDSWSFAILILDSLSEWVWSSHSTSRNFFYVNKMCNSWWMWAWTTRVCSQWLSHVHSELFSSSSVCSTASNRRISVEFRHLKQHTALVSPLRRCESIDKWN